MSVSLDPLPPSWIVPSPVRQIPPRSVVVQSGWNQPPCGEFGITRVSQVGASGHGLFWTVLHENRCQVMISESSEVRVYPLLGA